MMFVTGKLTGKLCNDIHLHRSPCQASFLTGVVRGVQRLATDYCE